jgi:predicted RNA-binding Zn ribbon-like protein
MGKLPVFELSGGALCLDFANTVGDRPRCANDLLVDYSALLAFGRQTSVLGEHDARRLGRVSKRRPSESDDAFRRAVEVRESLYRLFGALADGEPVPPRELARFNEHLAAALPHLRVVREGEELQWSWSGSRDALDRILWPVLRSAANLLTSDQRRRVRECSSETCSWLFIDRSPGLRRRWCDMKSCGNRAKARRHYKRKKAAAS